MVVPPPCPSPPPYYCDLTSHDHHHTTPLTSYLVRGRDVNARLDQQLQACDMALICRKVQGGVPMLREEWGWGWEEGERGEGEWWSWTVGDQRICEDQRILLSTDLMVSTDHILRGWWVGEARLGSVRVGEGR